MTLGIFGSVTGYKALAVWLTTADRPNQNISGMFNAVSSVESRAKLIVSKVALYITLFLKYVLLVSGWIGGHLGSVLHLSSKQASEVGGIAFIALGVGFISIGEFH